VHLLADATAAGSSMGTFDASMFVKVFVTLLVIVDPIGTVPLFLALTSGRSPKARHRLAGQAVLVSILVIAAFGLFGQQILQDLGISVPALQGAGGLLLTLVALELLTGNQEDPSAVPDVNVALVPLGTPLLAGPGAIVATIVFVRRGHGFADVWAIAAGIIAVHLILFLTLRFAGVILRVIREGGVMLVTRISGLLLSAIAVQLLATSATTFARLA
jgi:multiple antibiotic resistance protein